MAEDIDDLLDEVESKFFKHPGPAKVDRKINSQPNRRNIGTSMRNKEESDLNAIIDDICADNGPVYKPILSCEHEKESSSQVFNKTRKCYPVYIGGSQLASGLSSASVQRICDELRCTSCDFKVVSFDNYQWDSSSDYLFFRNNFPEFSKLKVNLIRKQGSRAYACQCSWRSASKIQNVESDFELRWVCGKHR